MVFTVSQSDKSNEKVDAEIRYEKPLIDDSWQLPRQGRPMKSILTVWGVNNFILAILAAAILVILGTLCKDDLRNEMLVVIILFGAHFVSAFMSFVLSWRLESNLSSTALRILAVLGSGIILLSVIGIIGFGLMINEPSTGVCENNGAVYMLAYGVLCIILYSFSGILYWFCF